MVRVGPWLSSATRSSPATLGTGFSTLRNRLKSVSQLYNFFTIVCLSPMVLQISSSASPPTGSSMRGLLVSIAVGAVLAVAAGLGTGSILSGLSNGKPANTELYNYGQR